MKITDKNSFCIMSSSIWQLIGYALFALKIIVPLVIIILGTIDFLKAITSSKEDGITNAAKSLIIRVIIGIVIFFIPSLINMIFDILKNASPYIEGSAACRTCLLEPLNPTCSAYKEEAKEIRQNQNNELSTENHDSYYEKEKEHCYFVYNTGDTKGKYIWGITDTKNYENVKLVDEYRNATDCKNTSNPTSILNYIQKPNVSDDSSGGSSTNPNPNSKQYLKFYNALTILHSGQSNADNTRELFESAGKDNFYGAECDLQMSSNTLWCRHESYSTGISFEEYMKICNEYQMIALLDIKYWGNTFYDKLANYIKENNAQDRIIIQTEDTGVMEAMIERVPNIKNWYLLMKSNQYSTFNSLDYKKYNIVGVNIELTISNESYIKNYLSNNLEVCVFSWNNWSDANKKKFSDYGVNYIMSNTK